MPVINAVPIFKPIWKLNIFPMVFTININIPPNIEFPIIFAILFNGIIKNFPIKNKNIMHAIYTIILFTSKTITFSFLFHFYDYFRTNIPILLYYI